MEPDCRDYYFTDFYAFIRKCKSAIVRVRNTRKYVKCWNNICIKISQFEYFINEIFNTVTINIEALNIEAVIILWKEVVQ